MADLQQFETELRAQHAKLTETFEAAQKTAEAAWAAAEAHALALTEFRAKYGRVLRAFTQAQGAAAGATVVTKADVGKVKVGG